MVVVDVRQDDVGDNGIHGLIALDVFDDRIAGISDPSSMTLR
jgi:hypothetical protein